MFRNLSKQHYPVIIRQKTLEIFRNFLELLLLRSLLKYKLSWISFFKTFFEEKNDVKFLLLNISHLSHKKFSPEFSEEILLTVLIFQNTFWEKFSH